MLNHNKIQKLIDDAVTQQSCKSSWAGDTDFIIGKLQFGQTRQYVNGLSTSSGIKPHCNCPVDKKVLTFDLVQ